jgi:hypothetical protein
MSFSQSPTKPRSGSGSSMSSMSSARSGGGDNPSGGDSGVPSGGGGGGGGGGGAKAAPASSAGNAVLVAVRIRPLNGKERNEPEAWQEVDGCKIGAIGQQTADSFSFNHVFGPDTATLHM